MIVGCCVIWQHMAKRNNLTLNNNWGSSRMSLATSCCHPARIERVQGIKWTTKSCEDHIQQQIAAFWFLGSFQRASEVCSEGFDVFRALLGRRMVCSATASGNFGAVFQGCSGLLRGYLSRFLDEKRRERRGELYPKQIPTNPNNPIK